MAELFWDRITGLLGLNNQNKKPTGVMDYASEDPEAISWGNLQPVQRSVPEYARNLGETWANMGEGSLLALRGAVADIPAAVAGAYTAFGPEAGLRRPGEGRMEAFGRGFTEAKQAQPIGLLREGYEELSAQTQPFSFGDMSQQDRMMAREMGAPLGLAEAAAIPTAARAVRGAANMAAEAVERSPVGQGLLAMQEQRGMPASGIIQQGYMGVKGSEPVANIRTDLGELSTKGTGAWATKSRGQAYTYANQGQVVPIEIEDAGFANVNFAGENWKKAPEGAKLEIPGQEAIDVSGMDTNAIARIAREQGVPGLRFQNIWDEGPYGAMNMKVPGVEEDINQMRRGGVEQYAVFDDSRIWPQERVQQTGLLGSINEMGMFSPLERAVGNLTQQKGSGQQMLAMIQKQAGVKPEEVQWTGLDEFLKSKPTVTKGEIEDYLLSNRVELRETTLGIGPWDASKQSRLDELMNEYANLQEHPIDAPNFGEEKYDELLFLVNAKDPISTQDLYRRADLDMVEGQRAQRRGNNAEAQRWFRSSEFNNARAEFQELRGGGEGKPKFGQYTLPGGENYREVLLTLPNEKWGTISLPTERVKKIAGENLQSGQRFNYKGNEYKFVRYEGDKAVVMAPRIGEQPEKYRSSHYDQPNILAHVRLNDRIDADGKKVLFVEEVQSDWHQAGRKSGYVGGEKHHVAYYDTPKGPVEIGYGKTAEEAMANADPGWKGLVEIKTRAEKIKEGEGVPDAPFKTSWHELALRRIMQEASEKGYDRIAFTKGAQQAERYDLSKQVDLINYSKNADGTWDLDAVTNSGDPVDIGKGISEDKISDYVGKEIADKIIKSEGKRPSVRKRSPSTYEVLDSSGNREAVFSNQKDADEYLKLIEFESGGTLSGTDLKVGGEGMKGFYDQILPKSLNKLGKKFDAKVGTTNLQTGDEVWSMDITPKMRKTAKEQGMPLFSAAPAIPGAGLLADQEDNGENRPMRSLMDF